MTPLILDPTSDTPEVILDKNNNQFLFAGTSLPEDIRKFYKPIFAWIEKYSETPNEETIVNFKFKYFNTSSSKSILDILIHFKKLAKDGNMLIINWHSPKDDDEMREAGEGFSVLMNFKFNYIEY